MEWGQAVGGAASARPASPPMQGDSAYLRRQQCDQGQPSCSDAGLSLSFKLGMAHGPQAAAALQHQEELGWLASSDNMLLVSYGSHAQHREAVEWTDTSMHFHDPLYSGSERWTPSPRPSSEGLLLFCRPASNDPSVTPRGTPSTAEPLDFTLSPLGTPTPPTLPVTLFEECSRCSGAGPSRRSSHLSQASLLSLSAPACAQDAIMSFDTLFSTVSSAQMLDSFSCQAALQEFNSDEYAASCYWGFAGPNTGGARRTSSRRTSLQPLSEAPWLLNAEEMTVPPSLRVLKQLEQAASLFVNPKKLTRSAPNHQRCECCALGDGGDASRGVATDFGAKAKGKEATCSSSHCLAPHVRQRRRADSADTIYLALERRLLCYLSSQHPRHRSALGDGLAAAAVAARHAGGGCAAADGAPVSGGSGGGKARKSKSASSPLPAKPHGHGGPLAIPMLYGPPLALHPGSGLGPPSGKSAHARATPAGAVAPASYSGCVYPHAECAQALAAPPPRCTYPGCETDGRRARSVLPGFSSHAPGPGMQSWSALASAYATYHVADYAHAGQGAPVSGSVASPSPRSRLAVTSGVSGAILTSPLPEDTPPHSCGPPVFSSYPEAAAHFRGLDLSGLQAKVQAEVRAAPPASLLQRLGCFAAPQTTLPSELRDEQVWLASLACVPFDASQPSHRALLAALSVAVPEGTSETAAASAAKDGSSHDGQAPRPSLKDLHVAAAGSSGGAGAAAAGVGMEGVEAGAVKEAMSSCFRKLGLQGAGADPTSALRGCGLLGLLQLYLVLQNDRAAAEALWQQLGQGAAAGSLTPAALSLAVTRLALQVLREGRLSSEAQRLQSYRSAFDRMYLGAMYRFLELCRSAKPGVPPSRLLQRLQAELKAKPAAFLHGRALHRARQQQQ